ncbi:MAG: hypothetical protein EOP11_22055, partial [Proteobacteria bacterium]
FFRDTAAFEALKSQLEEIAARKPAGEEFRVWVAGCATGEEAYSILFSLLSIFKRLGREPNLKIFASDLDQEALAQARSGLYDEADVADLPAEMRDTYFVANGRFVEVRKSVREMIVFARQDLVQSPPFVRLDLVTCRNVLIYLSQNCKAGFSKFFTTPCGLTEFFTSENPNPRRPIFSPPSIARRKSFAAWIPCTEACR